MKKARLGGTDRASRSIAKMNGTFGKLNPDHSPGSSQPGLSVQTACRVVRRPRKLGSDEAGAVHARRPVSAWPGAVGPEQKTGPVSWARPAWLKGRPARPGCSPSQC
jgi:hypothetical protein